MKLVTCTLHIKTATVIVYGHHCIWQLSIDCHYASASLCYWCWPLSVEQQQEVTKCTTTQNNPLFYSKFKISVIKQQNLITDIMMSNSVPYAGYAHYETISNTITHRHAHIWWPMSSRMLYRVVWCKHTEVWEDPAVSMKTVECLNNVSTLPCDMAVHYDTVVTPWTNQTHTL